MRPGKINGREALLIDPTTEFNLILTVLRYAKDRVAIENAQTLMRSHHANSQVLPFNVLSEPMLPLSPKLGEAVLKALRDIRRKAADVPTAELLPNIYWDAELLLAGNRLEDAPGTIIAVDTDELKKSQ